MRRLPFSWLLLGMIAAPASLLAQDDQKPISLGGFDTQGSVTTGYRFSDVHGYFPMFTQLFDLNSGFRLLDLSLFGKAQPGVDRFADNYSLTVSGLGGDPYTTAQLSVRKSNVYDLRVNFQQSRFYWNQNDAVSENGFASVTNNHNWATVRKLGSFDLLVHATKNLRFSVDYYRNTRDGVTLTTQTMDYFGSPSAFGSFTRANPYYLIAPISESTNRITGGVDYTHESWNFHYKIGYERFDDSVLGNNLSSNERSINVSDPATGVELLNATSWTDDRKLSTPISEFSYNGKITPKLEAHGDYLFYDYNGPASLDWSGNGIGRTNSSGSTDAPYSFSESVRASDSEPNNVVDQGFNYRVNDWLEVQSNYRYSRTDLNSTGLYRSLSGSTIQTGTSFNQWRIGTSQADLSLMFTPMAALLFDVGVRYLKSDVENFSDGVSTALESQRIKTVWPTLKASYQISKVFSVRGDLGEQNNGTSYTRITPHTSIGGRIVVRIQPREKLAIENATVIQNDKLLISAYHSRVRSNATNISWTFNDRFQVFTGFSYDSLFATDFTTFLRGTPPLTDTITDQTVNRIWQGGMEIKPVPRLHLNFTGNYLRSSGLGVINGEAPLFGPMTFPYATGSLGYDVPRIGILAVKLQRTYYIEQILAVNNFSAKLLTLSWTHNF